MLRPQKGNSEVLFYDTFCNFGLCTGSTLYRSVYSIHKNHRLIKITDRTLDVVFSRFRSISFTI